MRTAETVDSEPGSNTTVGYIAEEFSALEASQLSRHVSNLDQPVFTLRNLPQVTAAALFARYSRSSKSLRRLLLEEFLADTSAPAERQDAGTERAADLFQRVVADYGDDSVAQLGGVHLACEQVSQPLAKALEWGRLAAYLEQSTRYIAFTDRPGGRYRYHRDPALMASSVSATYLAAMDGLFDAYAAMIEPLQQHLDSVIPEQDDARARRRALRALALDLLRGLLPAGTVTNLGIFASPQALEQMVLRLRAHALPEAQAYAEMIAAELHSAVPDFVSRMDRPERGGAWSEYLGEISAAAETAVAGLAMASDTPAPPSVKLLRWDADAESRILAGVLFPEAAVPLDELTQAVEGLEPGRRAQMFREVVGHRRNRRHKPGRGFEHADYTFEIVSDYGAFRDLQRHRLLTVQWQQLSPRLGSVVPPEVERAGLGGRWAEAVAVAETAHRTVAEQFPEQAQYLVTLGHSLRYVLKLNAREAMHLIELRTSPQGHPAYRAICREMHRLIDVQAGHHLIAEAMRFVGSEDVHLPRYAAEAARGVIHEG